MLFPPPGAPSMRTTLLCFSGGSIDISIACVVSHLIDLTLGVVMMAMEEEDEVVMVVELQRCLQDWLVFFHS